MAELPQGKGWLQLVWDNALPLVIGFVAGAVIFGLLGRLAGWLFGL